MPPPLASDVFNSYPELSAQRSSCMSMRVFVLQPYGIPSSKFIDFPVPKIWPTFVHGTNPSGNFDLWALNLERVRNVTRVVTDNLPANYGARATFLCRVMGKQASDWGLDVWHWRSTGMFVMWFIVLHPYTKLFVGLPIQKIRMIFGHLVKQLLTLKFDLSTLNGVKGHPCCGLPFCQFSTCEALPFST